MERLLDTLGRVLVVLEFAGEVALVGAEVEHAVAREIEEDHARLGAAGVPASAVLDTADLYTDEHLQARDFVKTVEHPTEGEIRLLGWPARLSQSDVPLQPAPLLGQHTEEVLADLGVSAAERAQLIEDGVVHGVTEAVLGD